MQLENVFVLEEFTLSTALEPLSKAKPTCCTYFGIGPGILYLCEFGETLSDTHLEMN